MRTPATAVACLVLATLPNLSLADGHADEQPAWITTSNGHAQVLLALTAEFGPESAGSVGIEGHDHRVRNLTRAERERYLAATAAAAAELRKRRAVAEHPAVRQDLDILIRAADEELEGAHLEDRLMLTYIPVDRLVFSGIRSLLDARVSAERQQHAVARLTAYAGLDGGQPITEQAKGRTLAGINNADLAGPYRGRVEQDLARADDLRLGLRKLFAASSLTGWEPALATLEQQLADYNNWVRDTVLPRARTDHRLPPEIYANNLKQYGVDVPPEDLIRRALVSFNEIKTTMQTLAPQVAAANGIKATDYRDVIRALKANQLANDAVMPTYHARLATLEGLMRKHNIVSVPERAASIRLATEAESAMQPAPHMSPPRLIGNTGEYGEFVLTQKLKAKEGEEALVMDDFTHDAATWTLTVHEARPGHEMQFSAIVESGVSIARAVYAFNSVNVEGWALYAESVMQPYLPPDGQLIALQHRLMRAARAFLDPMVNLGRITPERAGEVLANDVLLSPAMVKQEVDRYSFRMPGQATSYFHGYQRLLQIRQQAELALGAAFNQRAFHDFVLAQGLVPPALLEQAVLEQFVPDQRAAVAAL